jgi:prepilin-type N-terminal cleavage/methylation domain-containing protein
MKRRGFTLLELLMALAVLGIILSLAIPRIPINILKYDAFVKGFYYEMINLREYTYRTESLYRMEFYDHDIVDGLGGYRTVFIERLDCREKYPNWEIIKTVDLPEQLLIQSNMGTKIRFDPNLTLGMPGTLTFFDEKKTYRRKITVDVWTNRIYLYKKEG